MIPNSGNISNTQLSSSLSKYTQVFHLHLAGHVASSVLFTRCQGALTAGQWSKMPPRGQYCPHREPHVDRHNCL